MHHKHVVRRKPEVNCSGSEMEVNKTFFVSEMSHLNALEYVTDFVLFTYLYVIQTNCIKLSFEPLHKCPTSYHILFVN